MTADAPSAYVVLPAEAHLREGDLIFRKGPSLESATVMAVDRSSDFSHLGLILRDPVNLELVVYHSLPASGDGTVDGVQQTTLTEFLAPSSASAYQIRRPSTPLTEVQLEAIRHFVQTRIKAGTPFNAGFEESAEHGLYCTQFVEYAYKAARIQTEVTPESVSLPFFSTQVLKVSAYAQSRAFFTVIFTSGPSTKGLDR
jgi:hypothetical protein